MTDRQYQELVEFLAKKFDSIDRRFDGVDRRFEALDRRFEALEGRFEALEGRTSAVETGIEALRDDLRGVAEGVLANTARIERLETTMNRRFDRMEEFWMDHERRIRALEN